MNQRENIESEILDLKELCKQVYINKNTAIEYEQKGDIYRAILTYQTILEIIEQSLRIFKKSLIWYHKKSEKQMLDVLKMHASQAESRISVLKVFMKMDPELFASISHENHIDKNALTDCHHSRNVDHPSSDYYSSYSKKIQRSSSFQRQNDIFGHSLRISCSNKNLFFENIFKNKSLKRESSKNNLSQIEKTSQPKQFPQTLRQGRSRSLIQNNAGKAALYAWNGGNNSILHSKKTNETSGDISQRFINSTIQFCSSLFSTSCRSSLHESRTSRAFSVPEKFQLNDHVFNSQYVDKNNIINEISNPTFKQSLRPKTPISIHSTATCSPDLSLNTENISIATLKNISPITTQKFIQKNAFLGTMSSNTLRNSVEKLYKEQPISLNSTSYQKSQNEITLSNTLKNTSLEPQNIDKKSNIGKEETREQRAINNLKGIIDENLLQTIVNDIVIKGDEVSWEDIAGLEEAKKVLKETVIYPLLRPDLFNGLREPATGVLLFGPPGTGKTMLAKAAATQAKSTFFSISASSLTSKFLGESEKLVRALFALAKELSPSIIFVDEIDALLSSRREDGNEHEASRRLKTEFLIQWSSLAKAVIGKEGSEPVSRVLVLAATNIPWAIDEAARRRFVRRQYIPLPERDTRMQQVLHLLKYQTHTLSNEDIENLVDITEGYSGSDITALTKDAAMGPLRCLGEALLTTRQDLIRPISLDDFKASLRLIRPSVSQKGLIEFEKFNREFGIQN